MTDTVLEAPSALNTYVVGYDARWRDQVLKLAREMHAESVFHRHIPMDEAKLIQQIEGAASIPDVAYFKLCVRGDEVLGGFFGQITSIYFSIERVAKDLAWFVTRNRRGSMAAVALVRDFEAWAKSKGVKFFVLGQSTGIRMDTTRALYEHLGYEMIGFNTVKRIA
jgi:hypothetical protein